MNSSTITLFKVLVAKKDKINLSNVKDGFITDFVPSEEQLKALKSLFKPLPIVTLFSVEERKTASFEHLLTKQILHYIETYGLETPGLFDLEVSKGKIARIAFIKAVTISELEQKVQALLGGNRPIKDISLVVDIIREYGFKYDLNSIINNELRIALYDGKTPFDSGDDAVRYLCYKATEEPVLIKSKGVIAAVKEKNQVGVKFFEQHQHQLAQVFNRHKKIILACKNKQTAAVINKISRLSKTEHVPVHESVSKNFVTSAVKGEVPLSVLSKISIRDKFKFLNYIEYKMANYDYDTFNIRNGKIWFENDRQLLDVGKLQNVKDGVLKSLGKDLAFLKRKKILLDSCVAYGLPISRKQSLGNLPYGTKVRASSEKDELSAGVYWRNDWGSVTQRIDLDLTAIDDKGNRTGWGQYSGYDKDAKITYSGDMTDASKGATEFMVVQTDNFNRYGLMVNIFSGPETVEAEIVVGHPSKKIWLNNTLIRERVQLVSKQSLIGFLKDDAFVLYSGRMSESRVAVGKHPVIDKGLGKLWTVTDLFDTLGIKYDTEVNKSVDYDYNLTYNSFTFDKLEEMFEI